MLFPQLLAMLDPEPHAAPLNMAIDEALLHVAEQPTLRVYGWREPALSFGYFDRIAEVEPLAAGRALVRRWTGGGIVEHGADVTYTLIVPRAHPFLRSTALESYRMIHDAVGAALAGAGMPGAEILSGDRAKLSRECFANPVRFDLMAQGAKIAGAAQRRTRWGMLHQGSIRTAFPRAGFGASLARVFGERVSAENLTREVEDAARELAESKYATEAWTRKF